MSSVIVVGAGIVGLAIAFELERAGHDVLVISADEPGSCQSQGATRIFRYTHARQEYTDAAVQALRLWSAWERQAGQRLLDRSGLLLTGDVSDQQAYLQPYGGLRDRSGPAHSLAVAQPHWHYEPTGAAIRADETMQFLQAALAIQSGQVTRLGPGTVELADGQQLAAERIIICAGPASYQLVGLPEPPRFRAVRFSFPLAEPLALPAPCWINRDQTLAEPFYALMDGPDHYAIGLSEAFPIIGSETAFITEQEQRVTLIAERLFPGLVPRAERMVSCQYPSNPIGIDELFSHDGWDLRQHKGLMLVTGPNLFKYAPYLADRVCQRIDQRL